MSFSELDLQWFLLVNEWTNIYPFLNPIMCFFALYMEYIFLIGILFYWFTRNKTNRIMVMYTFLSFVIAYILGKFAGLFLTHKQPFVHHYVHQLIPHEINNSFPSDHAIQAFVIAISIWTVYRKQGWIWIFLAFGISFSRVWVAVHYPSDIIVGALIGSTSALLVHNWFSKWRIISTFLYKTLSLYEALEQKILPLSRNQENQPINKQENL